MRNKISFLAVCAIALNINHVCASECIGEDCEIIPVEVSEEIDLLAPVKYELDWTRTEQTCVGTEQMCEYDYNCPFDNAEACAIWYKKPAYKTTLAPRASHINPVLVDDVLYSIYSNEEVSANDLEMKPLLQRYKILMNASDACCTAGIIYKMRENGADDSDVYEFLKDDANYYAVTKRCLVMNDDEINSRYSNGVTGQIVADVRNACLCKNRKWFESLLQPFYDIYERAPGFEDQDFFYTYTDDMQREISVSINEEIQNAVEMMSACPK